MANMASLSRGSWEIGKLDKEEGPSEPTSLTDKEERGDLFSSSLHQTWSYF